MSRRATYVVDESPKTSRPETPASSADAGSRPGTQEGPARRGAVSKNRADKSMGSSAFKRKTRIQSKDEMDQLAVAQKTQENKQMASELLGQKALDGGRLLSREGRPRGS